MADVVDVQQPGFGGVDRLDTKSSTNPTARTRSGKWRPQRAFVGEGMQVILQREQGITRSGYLEHSFRTHTGPVDTYTREQKRAWDTYRTLSDGEFGRSQGRSLRLPAFTVLLHDQPEDWQVWQGTFDVQRMIEELYAIENAEVVFRLVVGQPALWGPKPLLSTLAVLTGVTPEQRGGQVGSEYVTLEFQESRRQNLKAKGARKRPSAASKPRRHTLKDGDTLYKIAKRAYSGDASAWRAIAKKNSITGVGPDKAGELKAWAKRKNRKTLILPGYVDQIEIVGPAGVGSGLTAALG